ncbi:hypothetical protein ABPG74_006871 [Tetrahymena malaccensis]
MIKALKSVQRQLVFVQKARFCSVPNQNNQGQGSNTNEPQQQGAAAATTQTEKPQQPAFLNAHKDAQKDQKKTQNHEQKDQKQHQNQSSIYGSKINVGNSEEIKKSIQKSVNDFSSTYKLNLSDKKIKVGNKQTFAKKQDQESISKKKERLLKGIQPTQEKLVDKHIGNVPIAQQIVVEKLKKYALRVSDTKRIQDKLKSEEGVDFSYVEPRNLEILNSFVHRKSEEMEELISTYLGVNQTLSKEEQLDDWRQQQALDHINFTPETMGKVEVFYPGSDRGPHPLDDPKNFIQWYEKHCPLPYRPLVDQMIQMTDMKITDNNMPSYIKKWIDQIQEDPQEDLDQEKEDDQEEDLDSDEEADMSEDEDVGLTDNKAQNDELEQQLCSVVGGGQGVFFYRTNPLPRLNVDNTSLWSLDQISELPEDTSPEEQIINCEGNITFHSGLQDYEIPAFPETLNSYITHYQIPSIEKWSIFRQFPNMYHWWKKFYETNKRMSEQPMVRYQYSGIPSVYTYFYTMPEFARNNIVVQNVARCFEFNRPELNHQQKIMALNYAAKFALPLDDLIVHAASQMIVSQKHFLTAKEEDRLKTVNQFYYEADTEAWDIHLAHEEHTIEQIENFQAPKHLGVEEVEEQLCDLPLEYYDNDDGFWNDFIKEKLNRNNAAYPATQGRAFFKH